MEICKDEFLVIHVEKFIKAEFERVKPLIDAYEADLKEYSNRPKTTWEKIFGKDKYEWWSDVACDGRTAERQLKVLNQIHHKVSYHNKMGLSKVFINSIEDYDFSRRFYKFCHENKIPH